ASSSSCPGVRIVTATAAPLTRISSGSSTATESRSCRAAGNRRTSTRVAEYGGALIRRSLGSRSRAHRCYPQSQDAYARKALRELGLARGGILVPGPNDHCRPGTGERRAERSGGKGLSDPAEQRRAHRPVRLVETVR